MARGRGKKAGKAKTKKKEETEENEEKEQETENVVEEAQQEEKAEVVDGNKEEEDDGDEEEEFEVEKIIHHKARFGRYHYYYVKWKGYGDEDNTWEPYENLDGCRQLRDEFHANLDTLKTENPSEYKRLLTASEKMWKKSRPLTTEKEDGGDVEERGVDVVNSTPKLGEEGKDKDVETDSKRASISTSGKKRKSEDDDDVDNGGNRNDDRSEAGSSSDPPPKKLKQMIPGIRNIPGVLPGVAQSSPGSFLKSWLQKGSRSETKKDGASSSVSPPSASTASPVLKSKSETSFNRLFNMKTPVSGSPKNQASNNVVAKVADKAMSAATPVKNETTVKSADAVAAAERKETQLKALKRWENEMNSISKDPGKIAVENKADDDGPPPDFNYINNYLPRNDIVFPDEPLMGCQCAECDVRGCCPDDNEAEMAYSKFKRLRTTYAFAKPIYECNRLCKCGPDCRNRVVQRGRQFKLCIFKTDNGRGWGVKAMADIKAGSYVTTYLGELIDHDEAERRGKKYDEVGMTYLFDLDYAGLDTCYTIDAARYGNISHFINHSCDPNLQVANVFINNIDIQFPYLCLFACRDIVKDEELTFDYQMSGATEGMEESTIESSALADVSLSESRYDADRSGEESKIFVSASDVTPTKNGKDSVFFTPDTTIGKENITPRSSPKKSSGEFAPSSASPSKPSPRHLAASTPRKMITPRKALDKKTPCLCGTAKCRGYLMT